MVERLTVKGEMQMDNQPRVDLARAEKLILDKISTPVCDLNEDEYLELQTAIIDFMAVKGRKEFMNLIKNCKTIPRR